MRHAFDIVNLLTDQNPVQVLVDAIINRYVGERLIWLPVTAHAISRIHQHLPACWASAVLWLPCQPLSSTHAARQGGMRPHHDSRGGLSLSDQSEAWEGADQKLLQACRVDVSPALVFFASPMLSPPAACLLRPLC